MECAGAACDVQVRSLRVLRCGGCSVLGRSVVLEVDESVAVGSVNENIGGTPGHRSTSSLWIVTPAAEIRSWASSASEVSSRMATGISLPPG